VTTVNYFFNEYGQLRSAMGNTVGDANNEVWRDAVDGKPAGWVDQATTFEVENDYAVILGQAQVVKSVTTSWNATAAKVGAEWVFTANKVGDSHNYSRSVTTVNYIFNEYGQLRSATGNTVGDANNEVWRDADGRQAGGMGGSGDDVRGEKRLRGDLGAGAGGEECNDELERDGGESGS
jgi:hypothetical protein